MHKANIIKIDHKSLISIIKNSNTVTLYVAHYKFKKKKPESERKQWQPLYIITNNRTDNKKVLIAYKYCRMTFCA